MSTPDPSTSLVLPLASIAGNRLRRPCALGVLDDEAAETVLGAEEEKSLSDQVVWAAPRLSPTQFLASTTIFPEVEVLMTGWGSPPLDAAALDRLPALRLVLNAAGSIRNVATDAFWRRGVRITTAASMNAIPVAEYTLSQILFCLKHGWQRVFEVKARTHFRKHTSLMPGAFGSTVGLLSLGHTGRIVADHLRRFDLRVIAYDPHFCANEARALGVQLVSLDDAFARSDVVSCHTPHLPETNRLLRRRHFAAMRPGATFINTARGGIVDEPELIAVLQARPDLFAVLDVTQTEPPEDGSPLHTLPNVVVTPHIAGSLGREGRRMGRMMVEELARYRRGEPLHGEVQREQSVFLA